MSYEVEEMKEGECLFSDAFEDAAAIAAHFCQPVEKVRQICEWADEAPGVAQGLATGPVNSLVITAEEA